MRRRIVSVGLTALPCLMTGCSGISGVDDRCVGSGFKDDDAYSGAPSPVITGRVVYQGEPIGLGAHGQVGLAIWWALSPPFDDFGGPVDIIVDQDGDFSVVLFRGSYEIAQIAGEGPWVDLPLRVPVELTCEAHVEFPVVPYYTVLNESVVNDEDQVEATFRVGQVESSRPVEFVGLYVSTSPFLDRTNSIVQMESAGGSIDLNETVHLNVELPENIGDIRVGPGPAPRDHVWARIGIKTVGVEDMIFGSLHRLGL